jgi:hypothetical protein
MLRLLVTANIVPSSLILVTLMMVIHSCETSVLTRATRRDFLEDYIIQGSWFLLPFFPCELLVSKYLLEVWFYTWLVGSHISSSYKRQQNSALTTEA